MHALLNKAYENEIFLARHIQRELFGYESVISFKPLILRRVKDNSPILYKIVVLTAPSLTVGVILLQIFLMVLPIYIRAGEESKLLLETTGETKGRIRAALNFNENEKLLSIKSFRSLLYLNLKERLFVIKWSIEFLIFALLKRNKMLLMHGYDAPHLLAIFQLANRIGHVITDDQSQRWAFLLSHSNAQLTCVQHGYFDSAFKPPHKFGTIKNLYVLDELSLQSYKSNFMVGKSVVYKRNLSLLEFQNEFKTNTIYFLASSHPFFIQEQKFIKNFQEHRVTGSKLYFKFHPAHRYTFFEKLWVFLHVDRVISVGSYPRCHYLVSYNSAISDLYDSEEVKMIDLRAVVQSDNGNDKDA